MENSTDRDGIVFLYASNGDYACDAFDMNEYRRSGKVNIVYTTTDTPDLEGIVNNFTRRGEVVDVFESIVLKDAFLMTLRYIMADEGFPPDIDKMVREWYFGDEPKYKVLPKGYNLWS